MAISHQKKSKKEELATIICEKTGTRRLDSTTTLDCLLYHVVVIVEQLHTSTRTQDNKARKQASTMAKETASLQAALDSILARLSCLESTVGVQSPSPATAPSAAAVVEGENRSFY